MMKLTHKIALMTGTLMLALSGASFAAVVASKHDLSATGTGANHVAAGDANGEVCVFCHTPHAAAANAPVPLWNRVLANQPTLMYDSSFSNTIDGGVDLSTGISLACLSCHDGTQAMDTLLNLPGSGGAVPITGTNAAYTWTGSETIPGTSVAMLGTDLQNDHPVGIVYGGGGLSKTDSTGTVAQPLEFKQPLSKLLPDGSYAWYFDSDASTALSAADVRLYNRPGVGVNDVRVECASCHDPHNGGVTATAPTFLRTSNTGSAVCVACHSK